MKLNCARFILISGFVLLTVSARAESKPPEPFEFGDFTWLNGNNRQKSALLDTPNFTGSFLVDTNYIYDFNRPIDHSLVGSTSSGRTSEFQVQQLGIGGDFHHQHARGRLMTQFGMYSTMTPRNDGSSGRGQWDLADAYRYVSEAYGGYHWDAINGINLDAGIFMSYVGLFSYYNVENWAYQASYVSANTPWYFNGLRLQMFPSDRLKVELWLINGWQSYGMFNEQPGLGYQLLWRPNERTSWVTNGYEGTDTQDHAGRVRLHSDTSLQYKYFDHPDLTFDKAAFSLTADLGCENGSGVSCTNGTELSPTQDFIGFMFYNRVWFAKDNFAVTAGGGAMSNPGRYLVLLPAVQTARPGDGSSPTQGASATNNSCTGCFSQNPGDHFNAWDASVTFDYMPDPFMTFRAEYNHRAADTPYFAGHGGITSADGYNTAGSQNFAPDLVSTEDRINLAMMVRF